MQLNNNRWLWIVIASANVFFGCGPGASSSDEEHSRRREQPLRGGTLTFEAPEVGHFTFNGSECTGTLVSGDIVLTAAHCLGYSSQEQDSGADILLIDE